MRTQLLYEMREREREREREGGRELGEREGGREGERGRGREVSIVILRKELVCNNSVHSGRNWYCLIRKKLFIVWTLKY